jgi:hypothetical protein
MLQFMQLHDQIDLGGKSQLHSQPWVKIQTQIRIRWVLGAHQGCMHSQPWVKIHTQI